MDQSVKKLKFKLWFLLTLVFTVLVGLGGFLYYFGMANQLGQNLNQEINRPNFAEYVRASEFASDEFFTVRLDSGEAVATVDARVHLTQEELSELLTNVLEGTGENSLFLPHTFSTMQGTWTWTFLEHVDILLWDDIIEIPKAQQPDFSTPGVSVEFEITHLEGNDWLIMPENSMISVPEGAVNDYLNAAWYVVFVDVTETVNQLANLRIFLLQVGVALIAGLSLISYGIVYLMMKPVHTAFERQKQFIADASHELKTPLTIVKSNFDWVMMNEDETIKEQQEFFEYMNTGLTRMSALTGQLLNMAKLESSGENGAVSEFDIVELVAHSLATFTMLLEEKGINVTFEKSSNVMIKQNQEKFQQLVMILLDNAVKYVNESGTLDVAIKTKGRKIFLEIANSGPGIPQKDMKHIFDRFYRVDKVRDGAQQSFGLGLFIAKQLAEDLKGKIYVESEENKITKFMVVLKS